MTGAVEARSGAWNRNQLYREGGAWYTCVRVHAHPLASNIGLAGRSARSIPLPLYLDIHTCMFGCVYTAEGRPKSTPVSSPTKRSTSSPNKTSSVPKGSWSQLSNTDRVKRVKILGERAIKVRVLLTVKNYNSPPLKVGC